MKQKASALFEQLEPRSLFSIAWVFLLPDVNASVLSSLTLTNGILRISGTHKNDAITLTRGDGELPAFPAMQFFTSATNPPVQGVFSGSHFGSNDSVGTPLIHIFARGHTYDVSTQGIHKIVLNGGDGDDQLRVGKNVHITAQVNGGGGKDYLEAGRYTDVLNGGDGNDTLIASFDSTSFSRDHGGAGNDQLMGSKLIDSTTMNRDIESLIVS